MNNLFEFDMPFAMYAEACDREDNLKKLIYQIAQISPGNRETANYLLKQSNLGYLEEYEKTIINNSVGWIVW